MKNTTLLLVGFYRPSIPGYPGTDSVTFDVEYFSGPEWGSPGPEESKRLLMEKYGTINPAEVWPCMIVKESEHYTALILPV